MKTLLKIIALLGCLPVSAQQDPSYAQYLNNPVLINPGYAGINNRFQTTVGHRNQWAGFDGNPTTINVSGHLSFLNNKVGVGLVALQDRVGDIRNTEVSMLYAYKIAFGQSTLSFGLQAGMLLYRNDFGRITPRDPGDPTFNFVNQSSYNVGGGIVLKSEKYFIGFSAPRLMKATIDMGGQPMEIYRQHYYLVASYMVHLAEAVWLKPSVLLRATNGLPVSADLNFNINLDQHFTAGLLTRNFHTYGALMQVNFLNYRIGYVFELPTGKSLGQHYKSHEISLSATFALWGAHDRNTYNY
jgi:type IX secretion system PorP/SprF family membrane protein